MRRDASDGKKNSTNNMSQRWNNSNNGDGLQRQQMKKSRTSKIPPWPELTLIRLVRDMLTCVPRTMECFLIFVLASQLRFGFKLEYTYIENRGGWPDVEPLYSKYQHKIFVVRKKAKESIK